MKHIQRTAIRAAGLAVALAATSLSAVEIIKSNNTDALNLTSSWVGGVVPGTADVAVWDSTVTGANNAALGANATWLGLKVTNPGGLVTIGTGGSGLYLTTSGIDMSAATQNVVLAPSWFNFTGNQTWNVASGRNLRLANSAAGAACSDVDGSGTITVTGGGVVDANQGTSGGAGFVNFSGKFVVGAGTTLRGLGATTFAWGTSTAADTITLNGGTLAVGGISGTQGNWTWNQPITLGTGTTSTISAQNPDATARTLTFTGAITGSGNLIFNRTQAGGHVFWLTNIGTAAGTRTNVMGTGDITVNDVTLQPQVTPGTSNVITFPNNIKLVNGTLFTDDAIQTYTGTVTIEGTGTVNPRWNNKHVYLNGNIVDGGVAGSLAHSSNTLYLNGTNSTYSGGSNLTGGYVYVTSTSASPIQPLGTGMITQDGGQIYLNPGTVGTTCNVGSIRTRSDLLLGNNVLLNVTSGNVLLRMTNGFWIKASGTGTIGRLTSSSGTLNLPSVDGSWVTNTGTLTTADHQIYPAIVDFNGSTPLAVVKSGVNDLILQGANTYTGGTTINGGRLRTAVTTGYGTGTVTVNSGGQALLNVTGTFANNFVIAGTGCTEAAGDLGAIRFVNNTISGSVTVAAAGARVVGYGGNSGAISGSLLGTGNLEINSSTASHNGTITLNGSGSGYTGTVTVSQGILNVNNSLGGGVNVASGATLNNATGSTINGPAAIGASATLSNSGAIIGAVTQGAGSTFTNNGSITGDHTHTTGVLQGNGSIDGNMTLNGTAPADVLSVITGAMHVTGDVTLTGSTTIRASGLGGAVTVLTYDGTLTGDETNLSLENAGSFRPGTAFDASAPGIITLNVAGAPITWTNGATTMIWNTTDSNWDNAGSPDTYHQSDTVTFGDTGAGNVTLSGALTPSGIIVNSSNNYTFTGSTGNYIGGSTGITKDGTGSLTLPTANSFTGAIVVNNGNLVISAAQNLGGGLTVNAGTTTISATQNGIGTTTVNGGAILDLTGGGGQGGTISGTVNVNGTGILRLTGGDVTGWGTVPNRITAINLNGGTLEINNSSANQTFSNMAIGLTGGTFAKGAGGFNGSFDLFNGSTSVTSHASSVTSVFATGVNLGLRQPSTTFTTELGSTPSGIDLQINGSINNSPANWANPNLVKDGPGTLCLNNVAATVGTSTVYTGTTTINAGTLLVGTGGTTGTIGTGAITDNAALVFNRSDTVTLANSITGTGTLEQKGPGTLVLTAGGDRSGLTLVSGGSLYLGSTAFTATTVQGNAGTTLATGTPTAMGTATVPALALNGGTAAFRASTSLSDKIVVTGTNGFSVPTAAQISCTAAGSIQAGDTIQLIDYDGAIGGSGFLGLSLAPSANPHFAFTLVDNTTDTRVDASVTTVETMLWKGSADSNWDKTTTNWEIESSATPDVYYDYDKVKFTNAGLGQPLVTLVGTITPSSLTFDSTTVDYTLSGTAISGTTGLSLAATNTGKVTLTNENTYTGATTVNGGTLEIGNGGTTGSIATTTVAIGSAGTFAVNRSDTITDSRVYTGSGRYVKRGTGRVDLTGASAAFTGQTVAEGGLLVIGNASATGTADGALVANGGTINLNGYTLPANEPVSLAGTGSTGYALSGNGTVQGNINLTGDAVVGEAAASRINFGTNAEPINITGAFTLTKKGATSTIWYRGVAGGAGNTLAALVVDEGTFGIETYDNAMGSIPVTVNALGILSSWANGAGTVATTQHTIITLNGGTLGSDYAGQTWSGPVTLTGNSTLGATASAQNFTISGVIGETGGSYGLTKTQASIVTLSAINTYTGNTTINAGSIILADDAQLKFTPTTNGVCNKITGAGAVTLNGDFNIDLSGADVTNGNSWTLVDVTTKAYGATFTVVGFTEAADVHTKVDGANTWTFTESTGVLTLTVTPGYDSWIANYPTLPLDQRDATDDYDGDGFNNLLEYVLGGDPTVSDAATVAPAVTRVGTDLVFTYDRNDLSETDTTQVVQYGNDLSGWTDIAIGASPGAGMVAIDEGTPASDPDIVVVTIPDTALPAADGERFARLKVTKP